MSTVDHPEGVLDQTPEDGFGQLLDAKRWREGTRLLWSAFGRPDEAEGCAVCGREPSRRFQYFGNTGMLLARRTYRFDGPLCRHCALGMARAYQARTLTTGWWGFWSALITPVYLLANAVSVRTGRRRLRDPHPAHPGADALLQGKPLLARPAALGMIILLVAVGSWFAWDLAHPTKAAAELAVGDCFDDPPNVGEEEFELERVRSIPCADPHDNEVFANVNYPGAPGEFPTMEEFDAFVAEACLPAFASYVGIPYEASELYISYLWPTAEGWALGDREITCFIYLPGGQLEGTVRDSLR